MMGSRARLGICVVAATAAMAAVAGCSGGAAGSGATPTTPAASPTGSAAAVLSLVSDAMDKADSAGTVRIRGEMASGTTGAMSLAGQEQYSPSLELSMSMQVQKQTMSEVLIGTTFYMDYPELSAEMGGKPWGKIDLTKADGVLGSLSSLANSARNFNPATQLQALIASGNVTVIGVETVDGQQATHYQGKLTVAQMLRQAYGLTSAQTQQLRATLQDTGVSYELVDVWVPASGLPVEVKDLATTSAGQVSTEMHLSGWGDPVQIGAPPASQTFDLTKQLAGAGASATASASAAEG